MCIPVMSALHVWEAVLGLGAHYRLDCDAYVEYGDLYPHRM